MLEGFDTARHAQRIALSLYLYRTDESIGYAFVIKTAPGESDAWRV